jgi:hypothetical protein
MSRSLLTAIMGAGTTAGLFAACKADDVRTDVITCEIVYRVCPNVRRATADEARECAEIFQGSCGAHMRQYMQCATGTCDDAGLVSRSDVERKCSPVLEAYRTCSASSTSSRDAGVRPDEGQLFPVEAGTGDAG